MYHVCSHFGTSWVDMSLQEWRQDIEMSHKKRLAVIIVVFLIQLRALWREWYYPFQAGQCGPIDLDFE